MTIANNAGYRVKPISMPAARLYHSVKRGSLDLWVGALKMPSMKEHAYMLPIPDAQITLNLWYMEGAPPVTRIKEIKSGTLVVINGYVYGDLLKRIKVSELKIHTIKNWDHKAALHVLSSGRASYLLDYAEPIEELLKPEPIPGLRSYTLGTSLLALIIPKRSDFLYRALAKVSSHLSRAIVSGYPELPFSFPIGGKLTAQLVEKHLGLVIAVAQ